MLTIGAGNVEACESAFGGVNNDFALGVVQTPGGSFAACGYTYSFINGKNDALLVKFDSDGDVLWHRSYGGTSNDAAFDLVGTQDEGFALAGYCIELVSNGTDLYLS